MTLAIEMIWLLKIVPLSSQRMASSYFSFDRCIFSIVAIYSSFLLAIFDVIALI